LGSVSIARDSYLQSLALTPEKSAKLIPF
jgi:hypothetical protein